MSTVIQSFADASTKDLFDGTDTKAARTFSKAIWPVVRRKLDYLNGAEILEALRALPGNRLEALKGDRKGQYSIRVNQQYRITFRFKQGHAFDVRCEDYH